jgi:hypothetical protein
MPGCFHGNGTASLGNDQPKMGRGREKGEVSKKREEGEGVFL